MSLLVRNEKMRISTGYTVNFPLPALKASNGELICKQAGQCAVGCYASSGAYRYPVVNKKHNANYELTKTDSFVPAIVHELAKKRKVEKVRIHDGGDFYSLEYLFKWSEIARKFPRITFYAYTKEVAMIKEYRFLLPKNMEFIYSYGGKQDHLIDPETDRHSLVFSEEIDLILAGYSNASKDDTIALGINKKVGLVYHGAKSKNKFNQMEVA